MTTFDVSTLAALCDVFVPAVRPPAALADDPHGFFALTATEAGTADRVAALLPVLLDAQELDDLGLLLDVLRRARIGSLPGPVAQGVLRALSADDDAAAGIAGLRRLVMAVHYGGVGSDGTNPTWPQLGYPGPPALADRVPTDRLAVLTPPPAAVETGTWRTGADVVVVGSGAGGGVVAAELAAAGLDVLVVEAGGDHQETDFPTDELGALQQLYWRGGLATTSEGNVAVLAGHTLGGGTIVNWSNWVPPPANVLTEWAEHGVDGVDGPDFADDLAAVASRVGVSDAGTRTNGPNQRLLEGARALGWDAHLTTRNVDTEIEDDDATGHTGFGDRSGAKRSTLRTFLRDAVADGARVLTSCEAQRVTQGDGRATGVVAVWTGADGARVEVQVDAPVVVLAAGALETPGVLLRSAIGGPAAGRHLRLHPVPGLIGIHDEPQLAFRRAPQGVVVDEFASAWDGHGYLLEAGHWHPGLVAAGIAWPRPRDVKLLMSRFGHVAPLIAITRDRGSGSVTLGADGRPVAHYPLDDELDRQVLRQAVRHIIELHAAAGARAIVDPVTRQRRVWRRGQSVDAFADACAVVELGAGGRRLFTAHQMGTARIGTDPRTSVADPDGQLHDVRGVWIGDASSFPTAVGSHPMATTMAMGRRTARRILASR